MKVDLFELERLQSIYENQVEINLSDSGVEPLGLGELLGDGDLEALLEQPLAYPQTNGTAELRSAIAATYPRASNEEVVVTNGGSEANFVACWHLIDPGDEVVVMHPNYLQTHHLAEGFGARVRAWRLREQGPAGARRWAPDLDELSELVNPRTKLIVVCNPNNPTGARMTNDEVSAICVTAARYGTWILSDEIYRGAEHDGRDTATAWGRSDRVIVTAGLSKAYGLPGLRIGWVVADRPVAEALWERRDYTTIAPGALSDRLARLALRPPVRARLLDRARRLITEHYTIVRDWIAATDGLTHVPPEAGALAFVRYTHAVGSTELTTRLRETARVLVAPGDTFRMDGYVRIGFGGRPDTLRDGLSRLGRLFASLPMTSALPDARD